MWTSWLTTPPRFLSVINNMCTCHSDKCNSIAVQIWEFYLLHNIIWLTAAHIPGSSNCITDKESRDFRSEDTGWMVDPTLVGKALDALNFKPQIDLFASRLNRQLPIYCSFKPDPDAAHVDAFTLQWCDKHCYCFPPPFSRASKNHPGQSNRENGISNVANTIMVPIYDVPSCSSTNHTSTIQESSESSCFSRGKPSTAQKSESSYLSTIRQQPSWGHSLHIQIYCRDCCNLAGRENVTISDLPPEVAGIL